MKNIRRAIREHCPDNLYIRRTISRGRLDAYRKDLIDAQIAAECVKDPNKKAEIIRKCIAKWPNRFQQIREAIDPDVISVTQFEDLIFSVFAYGIRPDEYTLFDFAHKTEREKANFLSDKKYAELTVHMNDLFAGEVFWDKTLTYPVMKEFFHRDALVVTKKTPIEEIADFIDEHKVLVKKIGVSSFGQGVEKIDFSGAIIEKDTIKGLVSEWLSCGENVLLEELINQSDTLAAFNPSSVNTVRVITFLTRDGVITPYAFIKNGQNHSFVDNGGAGGILIGIDSRSGELITDGIDEHRNIYVEHPDTKKKYKGTRLPEWDEAIDLCKKMAMVIPSVKMVGWDIAHTDNGWVLIEANERSQIVGPQLVFNRGLKSEILNIMSKMELFVPLRGERIDE